MQQQSILLELERRFWRAAGDRERYAAQLAGDAVHVFPEWGIVDRDRVLEGVAQATPWLRFSIDGAKLVQLGADAAAIVYRTEAQRAGEPPYRAAVSSVYRRDRDGRWVLVVHQQTPLEGDAMDEETGA